MLTERDNPIDERAERARDRINPEADVARDSAESETEAHNSGIDELRSAADRDEMARDMERRTGE